jgi:hypothetical protein
MYYVLIKGSSYANLNFEAREQVRESLRENLETHGIRFLEYDWVWDEEDRCLLLVGQYRDVDHAYWWISALESAGFEICIRRHLPGDESWAGREGDGTAEWP